VDYRGRFGEPYCSIGCQLMGGTELIQAGMESRSGTCRICGTAVQASPYEDRCSVIPFVGSFVFVCVDCRHRANAVTADIDKCCKCGAPLA
jgi:hypothetical protein